MRLVYVRVVVLSVLTGGFLTLGVLAGVIQLLDAGVGFFQHDLGKTVGPLVIAISQFYANVRLKSSTQRKV